MHRFHVTRFTASVLIPGQGRLPVAATAEFTPSSGASSTVAATDRAPRGDATAWSYLMPDHQARWNPCQPIGYRLNKANAPKGTVTSVAEALQRVTARSGLRFVYQGATRIVPGAAKPRAYPSDTDIVMAWSSPGESSYLSGGPSGYAGASASPATDEAGRSARVLSRGFGVLDQTIYRQLGAGFGRGPTTGYQGTRGQLLMHEIGHTVGLGHADDDSAQTMYPMMSRKLAVWGAGDITGLGMVGASRGCLVPETSARVQQRTITTAMR